MSPSTLRFIRHYIEMLIAMVVGMAGFNLLVDGALLALGSSSGAFYEDQPVLMLLWMAFTMTVPMVAWMRFRGHAWRPTGEMAASMVIPTLALVALVGLGVDDSATLFGLQHGLMLPSMLAAMLLRRDEYTRAHQHHRVAREVTA